MSVADMEAASMAARQLEATSGKSYGKMGCCGGTR